MSVNRELYHSNVSDYIGDFLIFILNDMWYVKRAISKILL